MKIITRAVLDWDGNVLEEDSYEYFGPVDECKSSGSSPQPVDPYQQASAQLGLAEGTANYNAALNRTASSNPLGGTSWSVTGHDGTPQTSIGGGGYGTGGGIQLPGGGYAFDPGPGNSLLTGGGSGSTGSAGLNGGSGAPLYTQQTSLLPWANQALETPITNYNVVGDAGVGAAASDAEKAAYGQEMGYLEPQEQLQTEQNQSQLEAEGAMPGSAAYDYGTQEVGRQQTFANQQAANSAIGAGQSSLANLANIGSGQLQNELATRAAPISEYNSLLTGSSTPISASTPDISGAFNQQYQGALAGYNANTATNNANTAAGAGLGAAALLAFY